MNFFQNRMMLIPAIILLSNVSYAQYNYNQTAPMGGMSATQPASTAAPSTPAATSATPTSGTSLTDTLVKKANCTPQGDVKCSQTVTSAFDFITYAKQCGSLKGWLIIFEPSAYMKFTIIGGTPSGCQIKVDMNQVKDQPQTITCTLTQDQLQQMTSDNTLRAAQAYDASPTNSSEMVQIGKPIMDCIGPLNNVPVKVQNIPLPATMGVNPTTTTATPQPQSQQ